MVVKKFVGTGMVALIAVSLNGCATYYNHYGSFAAENASGELREHLLNWQTADYPDWWLMSDRSTPITLETQCSERKIRFSDRGSASNMSDESGTSDESGRSDKAGSCASNDAAIVWCGEPGLDLTQEGLPVRSGNHLCGTITDAAGDSVTIPELGANLQLNLQCAPAKPVVGTGDDAKNFDYLKMSSVPYLVSVKKVEKGSWDDRPLKLDTKICKIEE